MILFYVRLTLLLAFVRRVVISYSFTFQDCAGKSWVDCKVCGYFLPTAMSLASHILYLHPKYHKKVQESMDPSQLKKGRECICDLCDAVFSGRDGLRDHLKCRHGGGAEELANRNVPTQCPFCQVTHSTVDLYHEHANEAHLEQLAEENWIHCSWCKMFFPTETTFIIHRRSCKKVSSVEAPSLVRCEFCPETFKSKSSFVVHANLEHRDLVVAARWPLCQACDKFIEPAWAETHRENCSGDDLPDAVDEDGDSNSAPSKRKSKKEIVCPYCPMTFLHNHNFQFHVNQRHREQLVEANWVSCGNCPKLFVNSARLQIHQKTCLLNKPPVQKSSKVYPQKTNVACSFCPQVFANGGKFYAHANSCHSEAIVDSWLPCPECGSRFPTSRAMKMHLVRCNGSRKPEPCPEVPCQFCDLALASVDEITDHANDSHLEEIRDSWLLCNGCLIYQPNPKALVRHAGRCDKSSQRVKLSCRMCLQRFWSPEDHLRHMNLRHKEEISVDCSWIFCVKCENHFLDNDTHAKVCRPLLS